MFTKKLFKLSTLLVVLTLTLSVSAFAQIYVSVTQGDDAFGTGSAVTPYSSIGKAISVAATGSTIMVEAGTYNSTTVKPTATGAGEDALAVTGSKSLTFVAFARGIDVTVRITNGLNINTTGTVSLGETGETFDLGTTVNALKLTKGTLNIAAAKVVLGSGGTLTVGDGLLNKVPTSGANLNVLFNGANALASTSAFLPSSLGTGVVTINKATGALTIDNASLSAGSIAITNTSAVTISSNVTTTGTIGVAGGTAAVVFNGAVVSGGNLSNNAAAPLTLNGNVTMGSATAGAAADILNMNTGSIVVGASSVNTLAMYSTVDAGTVGTDANVGEIQNQNTGSITVNATVTENIKNTGTALDAGDQTALTITLPVITNTAASSGTGTITVNGDVAFVNTNIKGSTAVLNQVTHGVLILNAGTATKIAFGGSITTPPSTQAFTTPANAAINVAITNNGGGTLTTRGAALRGTAGTVGVINGASGTMTLGQLGDAFTTAWDITNAGTTLTLNGTGTLGGALTNNAASLIVLGASQTVSGLVTNNGNIKVNANTLTLPLTAAASLAGAGDIYSVTTGTTTVPGGLVKFTGDVGSSTYTGKLPNVEIASLKSFTLAGNTIWGNLVTSGAGNTGGYTIAAGSVIKGSFNLTGAALVTINDVGAVATTVGGDVNMTAGSITMGTAGLTVSGTLNMPQGTFMFGANTLTLKGNFNRTGGTINAAAAGTGKLYFNGTKSQSFIAGVQMNVNNVEVNNLGTYLAGVVEDQNIITVDGSLLVLNDFVITKGLVALGTNNIRMEQAGASARFTNGDRGYSATGIGGIIFEGSGAVAGVGTGAVITGSQPFSNLYVRLTVPANNVRCLGPVVISGVVTLDAGGILWNTADNGADLYTSSTMTLDQSLTGTAYPTVVINTSNTHGSPFLVDGADGGAVALAITTYYNLTYTSSTAAAMAATDFVTGKVFNLSLVAGTGKTITGLAAPMAIAGNLSVDALETLNLGTQVLTMSGNSAAHVVNGTVASGTLAITGNAATLTGSGTGACSVDAASTLQVTSASGTFTSTGMKVLGNVTINGATLNTNITMNATSASIPGAFTNTAGTTALNMNSTASSIGGAFTVTAGAVTLTMNGAAAGTRTITGALAVNGGTLTLGSAIDVTGAASQTTTGSIALGDNNLTLANTYSHAGTGTISAGAGAVIAKVAATQIYTLTSTVAIPNFTLNSAGFGIQLATNGLEVSNKFVQTAGDVDLNSLPLTISGNTYTFTAGTFTNTGAAATGVVNLTGSALVITAAANMAIPYVAINSTGTVTLASSSSSTARTLTVSQLLTQTKGILALGINDVILSGGTGYTFVAGSITATTTGTNIGELVFTGAPTLTPGASKSLTIPNLRIEAATAIGGTDSLYVANNLVFGKTGSFTYLAGQLILNTGINVTCVDNVGKLVVAPTFAGTANVLYSLGASTANVVTGNELPTDSTKLLNLSVDVAAGVATKVTLSADVKVNGTLTLTSGVLDLTTNSKAVIVGVGSTVSVGAGSINAAITPRGSYKLTYANSAAILSTNKEWPTAGVVSDLTVSMGAATPTDATLTLFENKSVTNLTLSCITSGSALDLNGKTLTVTGLTTLTKGTILTGVAGGTLAVQGDVNASGGSFGSTIQMAFTGSGSQAITTPSGGASIGNITINKTSGSNIVSIKGGDLTCSGIVTFMNGLLKTDSANALVLTNAAGLGTGKGYSRAIVTGGKSHVVGNVKQNLQHAALIAYARNEFPVGDTANYRPVALTFVTPTSSGLFGIFATVSHTNARPTGTAGLPIANGIATGVDLAKYPSFFWSIKTDGPMGNTQFNLDLTAAGFNPTEIDLNAVGTNLVKIIRRSGVATDLANQWNLQGSADSYDNIVSTGVPTVTAVAADGGLTSAGAIFTYGIKSTLYVVTPIANQTLTATTKTAAIKLTPVFGGNTGALTYAITNSNAVAVSATISSDTLKLTNLRQGTANITVTATDVDNSRISTSFTVTTSGVGVEVVEALPTEFSLSQNYPNPFNPSTTIKFGLPVASTVSLKVYNILGEEVANLVNKDMPAGFNTVIFDASRLGTGMYIYRIQAGNFTQVRKMMLVK
jgi:hypothetical protein